MQAQRQVKTLAGRPSTPDVGILSFFLQEVKTEIETKLSILATTRGQLEPISITNIFPVFPLLPALQEDDIRDALQHVGLDWQTADRQLPSHIYYETNAALAGYGLGLCPSWNDMRACAGELARMDFQHILFLNFDSASFSVSLQYIQTANQQWGFHASALDTALGWDSLPLDEIARAKFWARIQERIVEVAGTIYKPKKVVLLGKEGCGEEFVQVVVGALEELDISTEALVVGKGTNGWMAPARGAAELAGRREWQKWIPNRNWQEWIHERKWQKWTYEKKVDEVLEL